MIGEKVAREGVWDVGAAMWFSTVVYLPLGIFLTYQAVTDSMLMTSESYAKLIQRLNIFKHIPRGKKKQKAHENTGSLQ
jgi:lipopolysaccharide export system permease protein